MTRVEYDLLREQEPHLKLPTWPVYLKTSITTSTPFEMKVDAVTREEMIGKRAAYLIGGGSAKPWLLYDP